MKVAYVSTLQPDTNYFRYLALALEKQGIDLVVYADRNPKNLEVGLKNVHLLWAPGDRLYPLHILRQALRDRPDVIHLHHEVGLFGGPINASIFPLVPILLRLFGFRVVTTIHAVVRPEEIDRRFLETFNWPQKTYLIYPVKLYFFVLNWVIALFSHRVIVHAEVLRRILGESYHCPVAKIKIIPHGVPEEVEHISVLSESCNFRESLSSGNFLLYFGYLHRRKGIDLLIKSFAKVAVAQPDLKLVLAGGALQKGYDIILRQLISDLVLDGRVIITGFVTQPEIRYLLDHCLFVVLPATYSIAASGPLAQVIAHEKPVIVSALGVYEEEIKDDVTGLLARPNDVDDLSVQILKLLTNEGLRERLAFGMKELHRERGWNNIAGRTIALYEEVI